MQHLFKNKKTSDALSFGLIGLILSLFLVGCGTTVNDGTPVHDRHAKRGYNKPYQINGAWYYPQGFYEYCEVGKASYYGCRDKCHGRKTSTGQVFNMHDLTAASKELPLPCVVQVTNLENGRSLKLKVVDRGPFVHGRIIDVSTKAAKLLGFYHKGVADVRVEALVAESLHLAKHYNPNRPGKKLRQRVQRPRQMRREQHPVMTVQNKRKAPAKTRPILVAYQTSTPQQKKRIIYPVNTPVKKVKTKSTPTQMGVY